jgi:hypothetical protein
LANAAVAGDTSGGKSTASRRPLRRFLGILKTTVFTLLLVGSLALNVASLTIGPVFEFMSSMIERATAAIAGEATSVRSKHGKQMQQLKRVHAGKVAKLDRALQAQRRAVAAGEKYIGTLKQENLRLRDATTVTYRGQRKLVSEAVEDTTSRLGKRIVRDVARNTGSLVAESIPYIGIGVAVSVTTWEVSDACENMKDLYALAVALNPGSANDADKMSVCGTQVPTKEEILRKVKAAPGKVWEKAKDAAEGMLE